MIQFKVDKFESGDCGGNVPLAAEIFEWIWTIVVVVNFIFIISRRKLILVTFTPSLFLFFLYLFLSGEQCSTQPLLPISPRAVKLYLTDSSILQKIQSVPIITIQSEKRVTIPNFHVASAWGCHTAWSGLVRGLPRPTLF